MNENVEKLQQMYAAFGRGDIDAILANVTDDVTWGVDTAAREVPMYGLRDGREGVADFFATLAEQVDFKSFEPKNFAAAGDEVLVTVDYDFQFRKNGKGQAMGALHRFRIRNGKVSSFRAYEDTAAVRSAWAD